METHKENSDDLFNSTKWTVENEEIIIRWCDTAQCYRWLCYNSHKKYANLQAHFAIPTIILSTIIGAASFTNISNGSILSKYSAILPILVGSINITIGIMNTIQQYFKVSEYNENYRICALAWDKYERFLSLELSTSPSQRESFTSFFKKATNDFDRLMETTPIIPDDVIKSFKKFFDNLQNSNNIYKPAVLDSIMSSHNYRHRWYMNENNNKVSNQSSPSTPTDNTLSSPPIPSYNNV